MLHDVHVRWKLHMVTCPVSSKFQAAWKKLCLSKIANQSNTNKGNYQSGDNIFSTILLLKTTPEVGGGVWNLSPSSNSDGDLVWGVGAWFGELRYTFIYLFSLIAYFLTLEMVARLRIHVLFCSFSHSLILAIHNLLIQKTESKKYSKLYAEMQMHRCNASKTSLASCRTSYSGVVSSREMYANRFDAGQAFFASKIEKNMLAQSCLSR